MAWYNGKHLHSGVRFATPDDRHAGKDTAILAQRRPVYEGARAKNPARWAQSTRNWTPVEEAYLNPEKPSRRASSTTTVPRRPEAVAA